MTSIPAHSHISIRQHAAPHQGLTILEFLLAIGLTISLALITMAWSNELHVHALLSHATSQVRTIRDLEVLHLLNESSDQAIFVRCPPSPDFPPPDQPIPFDDALIVEQPDGSSAAGWLLLGFKPEIPEQISYAVEVFSDGSRALILAFANLNPPDWLRSSNRTDPSPTSPRLKVLQQKELELETKIASLLGDEKSGMQIMQLDHLTRQEQLKTSCELERERIEEWFHTRINELQELTKTRKEATRIEFALEQKLATIDLEYQRKRLSLGKQASEAKRKLEQEIAIIRNSQEQYKTTLRQEIIARFSQQRSNLNERHTKRLELVKKQALKELREIRKDKAQLLRSPALLGTEEERRIDDQILSIKRDYHSTAQRYEIEQQQEIEALTMAEEKELLGLASLVSSSINTKVLELTTKIKTYELRTKQIQEQIEVDRQEREEELTHILNHALAKVDTEREQLRLELHNLHRQELAKNNLSCNQELQRLLAEKELAEQSLRARYQQIVRIEISALNELRSSAMRAKDHDLRVATFIAHKRHRNLTVLSLTLEASRTETSRVRTSHMYMEGLP